jgi:branched-chain amino acid transport system permease protein
MNQLANIAIDGVAYGMVLFMLAVGLSMTLGLMRVVNLAHGAFAMLGGFVAAYLPAKFGMPIEVGILLAVVVAAAIAIPIERVFIRRFYRRDHLDQMLLTIGIMFIFMATASVIFGPVTAELKLPSYLTGSVDLGFRTIPRHRLFVVGIGCACLALLWIAIDRSSFGIKVRAAVDNANMAESLGVNTAMIYSVTFALGAALAAIGGILGAELMPIEAAYASKYLIPLLAVVAVGGQGTIFASFFAALVLGVAETAAKYLAPDLASIVFSVTMCFVLVARPQGLFGKR